MIQQYYRPKSVKEATALKAKLKQAAYLGGGTEINSSYTRIKPPAVIALDGLKLDVIKKAATGVSIGACVTLQTLADSTKVPPALRAAAQQVVNRNVRNRATLGGNIGANKSCSNLIPALLALGAKLKVAGKTGTKAVALEEYLQQPQGLIVSIELPKTKRTVALRVFRRTANDISLITVAAGITQVKGIVTDAVVAVGGVNKTVVRLRRVEQALINVVVPHDDSIAADVAKEKVVATKADIRGSAEFKRHLAGVLVAEAVAEAVL